MRQSHRLNRFWKDQDGTAALEYLVVLGLIVVAIIGVAALGLGVLDVWQKNGQKITPILKSGS